MIPVTGGNLHRVRVEVDWPEIEAAWDKAHSGPGRNGASRDAKLVKAGVTGEIVMIEKWHGLFGGLHHDEPDANLPTDSMSRYMMGLTHGQIQETTFWPVIGRKKNPRPMPGEADLHQLTPGQSFLGTLNGPLVFPEDCRPLVRGDDRIGVEWNASQKDRGAHVALKFWILERA